MFMKILSKIFSPIYHQFPFFLLFIISMGYENLQNLHGKIIGDSTVTYFDIFRRFSLVVFTAYIFIVLIDVIKRKWFLYVSYSFLFSLFFIQLFIHQNFQLNLSPYILTLLAETNSGESSEFLKTYILSYNSLQTFIVTLCLISLAFLLENRGNKINNTRRKNKIIISMIVLPLLIEGAYASKTYFKLFAAGSSDDVADWMINDFCQPHDTFSYFIYALKGFGVAAHDQERSVSVNLNMDKNNTIVGIGNDSLNIILVIGESFIKRHAGIYGYSLNTTPVMREQKLKGNLSVFNDVVSPYAYTNKAIHNMLCCNSVSEGERWYDTPYFPGIFKSAGYNVYFWDNQKEDSPNIACSVALNSLLYNSVITQISYTKTNQRSFDYDGQLIENFIKNVKFRSKLNFIIFHLMGQHTNASDRYPHTKDFNRFSSKDIPNKAEFLNDSKRQEIAYYDNATYYNDYVLGQIFNFFSKTESILVYLSDHGEEIYDYRDSRGRVASGINANLLRYQYDIPFFIWYSDKFKQKHMDVVYRIEKSVNRPFTSDNLCHLLFDIGSIKTVYRKSDRDLISPTYKCRKRIVNDSYDYDKFFN